MGLFRGSFARTSGAGRTVALVLAVLALALRVAVPQGYMVAAPGAGFPLVICTGHGELVLGDHGDHKSPAQKSSEAPCVFAGSVTPLTPSIAGQIQEPFTVGADADLGGPVADLAPGRGLAAPPPQSRAPPVRPI
jgi:hypothetical protein